MVSEAERGTGGSKKEEVSLSSEGCCKIKKGGTKASNFSLPRVDDLATDHLGDRGRGHLLEGRGL